MGKRRWSAPNIGRLQHTCSPADGKSWNLELFAPHPTYSRFELVDRALGRLWSNGALGFMQNSLRSLMPHWQRQDRAFVAAHIRFMENSIRLRQACMYLDGTKSVRRAALFAAAPEVRMKVIHLVRDGRGFLTFSVCEEPQPRAAANCRWPPASGI